MAENLLPCDGEVFYFAEHFPGRDADDVFSSLLYELDWRQESARLFGRAVLLPRLTAWYGPVGYAYSSVIHPAAPFPTILDDVAKSIAPIAGTFDCVLANLYRDESDSVSWHSDDESMWGPNPTIVSASFGATRRFRLRHRHSDTKINIDLEHGSVLVMSGATQHDWEHAIPKTRTPIGQRVNLTFRRLVEHVGAT